MSLIWLNCLNNLKDEVSASSSSRKKLPPATSNGLQKLPCQTYNNSSRSVDKKPLKRKVSFNHRIVCAEYKVRTFIFHLKWAAPVRLNSHSSWTCHKSNAQLVMSLEEQRDSIIVILKLNGFEWYQFDDPLFQPHHLTWKFNKMSSFCCFNDMTSWVSDFRHVLRII